MSSQSTIIQYKNADVAAKAWKKCGLPSLEDVQLNEHYESLEKRLLHTIVKRVVGEGVDRRLRWIVSQ